MLYFGDSATGVAESMTASIEAGPPGAMTIDDSGHYRDSVGQIMYAPNGVSSWTVENWRAHTQTPSVNYGTRKAVEMEALITGYMDKGYSRVDASAKAIVDYDKKHAAPVVPLVLAAAAVVAAYFFLS